MTIEPARLDGFLASIIAADGFGGCRAILHGPGGCRINPSRAASRNVLREFSIREGPFYFSLPRVPCTFIDEEDYINGADYKVEGLLDTVDDAEVCVIVCSPGASLIGDDLHGAAARSSFGGEVIVLESNHASLPAHVGYDAAVAAMVGGLCGRSETRMGTVNILGVPVFLDGWEDTVREFRGYLEAMGLEVLSAPGCGCSVTELRVSTAAEFNVTVLPEFAWSTSEAYARLCVPTFTPPVPAGFGSTESWISAVADRAGADPSKALGMCRSRSARARAVLRGNMFEGLTYRNATYSLDLDSTAALPLMEWLYSYLGMFPAEVVRKNWWTEDYAASVEEFLDSIGCAEALVDALAPARCDVVLGPGQTARLLEVSGRCMAGIDLWPPSLHNMWFRGRPFLGAEGALRILDEMFEHVLRD
ncbi:MAG: nitrogenase component 1 [Thermoplasmata archaeon]|nr:nitrogenase component 1 [Thermoplasmata archaeon]